MATKKLSDMRAHDCITRSQEEFDDLIRTVREAAMRYCGKGVIHFHINPDSPPYTVEQFIADVTRKY